MFSVKHFQRAIALKNEMQFLWEVCLKCLVFFWFSGRWVNNKSKWANKINKWKKKQQQQKIVLVLKVADGKVESLAFKWSISKAQLRWKFQYLSRSTEDRQSVMRETQNRPESCIFSSHQSYFVLIFLIANEKETYPTVPLMRNGKQFLHNTHISTSVEIANARAGHRCLGLNCSYNIGQ